MAKNKNIETDSPVLRYEADPRTFQSIILKVHKKLEDPDSPYVGCYPRSAGENDAMLMSIDCPNEPFVTVYQNGIPVTMSVSDLVKDVILSVIMKEN